MSIPLLGQGNALPEGFPYQGFWILEPRIFLFISDDQPTRDIHAPRFAEIINPNGDDWAFGFDAHLLAEALSVSQQDLFAANGIGRLTLESIASDTPDGEDATIKRYTFGLRGRHATVVIQNLDSYGHT
ncbi:hypothetical protein FHT86_004594 [Rhizobium sp. BK313]|uniref:hypothetical protein n=1 Tax=Rhizobium sp. BK313 TaxID=2587081 RepID=UPI00105E4AAD|nr:hypothetical protein [Rhizobium sp. BK313]MBB3456286.1 hypothetical protein [Rhizobium sp. BK313]